MPDKKIIKTILYPFVILGIINFLYFFVPLIPQKIVNPCFLPPCPESLVINTINRYSEKYVSSYVEKNNLHIKGQESFMDAVRREHEKLNVLGNIGTLVFIYVMTFFFRKNLFKQ